MHLSMYVSMHACMHGCMHVCMCVMYTFAILLDEVVLFEKTCDGFVGVRLLPLFLAIPMPLPRRYLQTEASSNKVSAGLHGRKV